MNILSLFDGMSCGRIALDRAGIDVDNYYASELDKYAIKVSQANWPENIQLGDVTKWREWDINWSSIDLLIGGSPCQGFSFAGKQLAFNDPRSALFFEYLNILSCIKNENPNIKFMLENVKMKQDYLDVINEKLGVKPILINSSLVSAQNRPRYYWGNFRINQPKNRDTYLSSVLESGVAESVGEVCFNDRVKGVTENERGYRYHQGDSAKSGISELGRILKSKAKFTDALTTSHQPKLAINNNVHRLRYRKLTVTECERLQTVADGYTQNKGVSDSQCYKMLGNGWTVEVIAHIFKGLKDE